MMIDGGVVFLAMLIVIPLAFLKGYLHDKKNRDDNPLDRYSDRDIQRFKEMFEDLQKSKKL